MEGVGSELGGSDGGVAGGFGVSGSAGGVAGAVGLGDAGVSSDGFGSLLEGSFEGDSTLSDDSLGVSDAASLGLFESLFSTLASPFWIVGVQCGFSGRFRSRGSVTLAEAIVIIKSDAAG